MTAALPNSLEKFWPGFAYSLDLDIALDGVRPDWAGGAYTAEAKFWRGDTTYTVSAAVEERTVQETPGATGGNTITYDIPVIGLTTVQTEAFRGDQRVDYVIYIAPNGGEPYVILQGQLNEQAS